MPSDDCDQRVAEARAAGLREATDPYYIAKALHETAVPNHNVGEGPLRAICDSIASHAPRAEAIRALLAAPGAAPAEGRETADEGNHDAD